MLIKQIKIKNFRGFREEITIDIDKLTVFIGKNDAGKSTILEALEIFFNDRYGRVKIDEHDLNKQALQEGEETFEITVVFDEYPSKIDLDRGHKTTLQQEYLLNKDGYLEIKKVYRNGRLQNIFIRAWHPINELTKDLLLLKQQQLKRIIKENGIQCENMTINAVMRNCIREFVKQQESLRFEILDIPVKQEDAKAIWEKVARHMPIYALFQSDRANKDQDSEVQDPIKIAVKEIIHSEIIQNELDKVATQVREKINQVVQLTLDKLKEIAPDIAKNLKASIPQIGELKWEDVFKKITITSDEDIPLNKRGSGVRRLVLLNFFRAQAEQQRDNEGIPHIIYALEEPETSLHPDHQKMLISSLSELAKKKHTQILLTTHSPAIAQLIPTQNIRFVKKANGQTTVLSGKNNKDVLAEVVDTLGILPVVGKIAICVEGENDRNFLLNINDAISELRKIVNLRHKSIVIIPMHGGNLRNWIDRNYLENSNIIEFHIYDNDKEEYREKINQFEKESHRTGVLTNFREFENYIHPILIEERFNIKLNDNILREWPQLDVPKYIVEKVQNSMDNVSEKSIKNILNKELARKLTKELLTDIGAWEEVKAWFEKIKNLLNKTYNVK